MAEVKQTIVQPEAASTTATFGARNDTNLKAAYPDSPILDGSMTDAERRDLYERVVNEGPVGGGFGVASFNPKFYGENKSPDIENLTEVPNDNGEMIEIGQGAGAPTTPYVPPLTSPGTEEYTADKQGPWTGDAPTAGTEYGSGMQNANPSKTSESLSAAKIGDTLTSGRSYPGSDGR